MEKLTKSKIVFFLKLALSVVILLLIIRSLDLKNVFVNISSYSLKTVIVVLIVAFIKHVTQYYNWKKFLQINPDFSSNEWEIVKSYLIGLALRFVMPGGLATFGKVYYVENTSKKDTALSIGLEKVFGTWTIWLFAGWASIFYFKSLSLTIRLIIVVVTSFFPIILYNVISKISRLNKYLVSYKSNISKVIISQLIYESSTFIQYWLLINTFVSISIAKVAYSTALILFSNTIPITFSGLGLRELFAINVLSKYGVSSEIAVASAFSIFLFNDLLPSILGVYFILKEKKSDDNS